MALNPCALAALVLLAAVPGCGRVKDATSAVLARAGLGGGSATVPASRLSRDQVEKIGQPVIHVMTPARGQDTLLVIRDRGPGDILAWGGADATLFTFRDGVLIETRGLGSDLMSSSAPSVAMLRSGAVYRRDYFVLGSDDRTESHPFRCSTTRQETGEVAVYGLVHSVTHLRETCDGRGEAITNDYWLEGATVRKAREWVSPDIGHVWFERVID